MVYNSSSVGGKSMNYFCCKYSSRNCLRSVLVWSEKSSLRRFFYAISVLYMYVQYVGIERTESPVLFFLHLYYTQISDKNQIFGDRRRE